MQEIHTFKASSNIYRTAYRTAVILIIVPILALVAVRMFIEDPFFEMCVCGFVIIMYLFSFTMGVDALFRPHKTNIRIDDQRIQVNAQRKQINLLWQDVIAYRKGRSSLILATRQEIHKILLTQFAFPEKIHEVILNQLPKKAQTDEALEKAHPELLEFRNLVDDTSIRFSTPISISYKIQFLLYALFLCFTGALIIQPGNSYIVVAFLTIALALPFIIIWYGLIRPQELIVDTEIIAVRFRYGLKQLRWEDIESVKYAVTGSDMTFFGNGKALVIPNISEWKDKIVREGLAKYFNAQFWIRDILVKSEPFLPSFSKNVFHKELYFPVIDR